jgi:hypothetical protein
MYVFHYDPNTLAYTGNSPVDFCQLEPGTVLVPAWASKTPPPGGWDSRIKWPYYVSEKDAWQVRPLPALPVSEPEPEPAASPVVTPEMMQISLQAHIDAAQRLMAELKAATAPAIPD